MSLLFGAIILLIGSLVSRLESHKLDIWTWINIMGIFLLSTSLAVVFKKISTKTKEIRDL